MASSKVIRELLVSVGVEVDDSGFRKFDLGIDQIKEGLGTLLTMAGAAAGAVAAVTTALGLQADATAREAVELDNLAKALGTTSQELAGITAGAREFGADFNDVADLFTTLADRAEDAKGGMASFVDDFALAGVAVQDLEGKNPSQLVHLFADSIAGMEDPTKRAAAAVRILGDDAGRKLLPMLMKGSAGLKAYTEEIIASGGALDEEAVAASKRYVEVTRQIGVEVKGIRNQIGAALIPTMIRLAAVVLDGATAFREMIAANVERWGDSVERAFVKVQRVVQRNAKAFTAAAAVIVAGLLGIASAAVVATAALAIVGIVGGLASALSAVAGGLALLGGGSIAIGVLAVLGGLLTLFAYLIPPVLLFAAAVIALGLAFEDFQTHMAGGESALGTFLEQFEGTDTLAGQLIETLKTLGSTADSAWESLKALGDIVGETIDPALTALSETFETMSGWLGSLVGYLAEFFGYLAKAELKEFQMGLEGLGSIFDTFTSGLGMLNAATGSTSSALAGGVQSGAAASRALSVNQQITVNGNADPQATGRATMGQADGGIRSAMQFFRGGPT